MEWDTGTDFDQLLEEVFPPVLNNEFHEFFLDDGNGRVNKILENLCDIFAFPD